MPAIFPKKVPNSFSKSLCPNMSTPLKVLIVDDEVHIRKLISLIIRQVTSVEITEVTNGQEALEVYPLLKPDLVLMDVNMPIKDGLAALKELTEMDPEALIVMLTSLANRQSVEDAFQSGAIHYIRKDTPKDEIIAALKKIVSDYYTEEGAPHA